MYLEGWLKLGGNRSDLEDLCEKHDGSEGSAIALLAAARSVVDGGAGEWGDWVCSDLYPSSVRAVANAILAATSPARESAAWRAAYARSAAAFAALLTVAVDGPSRGNPLLSSHLYPAMEGALEVASRALALELGAAPGAAPPRSLPRLFAGLVVTAAHAAERMGSMFPVPVTKDSDLPRDFERFLDGVMSSVGKLARVLAKIPASWDAQLAAAHPATWAQQRREVQGRLGRVSSAPSLAGVLY
jgi:hypothetical protein